MTGLLAGKSAFVTGAAQGIGLAVARAFVAHGATVTLADVQAGPLDRAVAALGPPARGVLLDVTDAAATDGAAAQAGVQDIVVANAGILVLRRTVELTEAEWRRVLDVNLTGAFLTCRAFVRTMLAAGRPGCVILTSSLFGLRGGAENAAYAASKFGMIGLAQCLAAEVAAHGISVNCVCPGQVDTEMMQALFLSRAGGDPALAQDRRRAFERRIPAGALGRLDEIAGTYVWLASGLSSYVTGQAITVDGGWQVG